ncbi:hypothetical protein C8J56DRAFT_757489, partial [Mycena floridula]
TQAFAKATGQKFAVYYSVDSVGQGRGHRQRTVLTGQNAEDAWNAPLKAAAHDLGGRLALVVGMPVFIVDNIAVELGVSNGSRGTLTDIVYEIREGKRYVISVDVNLELYTSSDPNAIFPHRLTL